MKQLNYTLYIDNIKSHTMHSRLSSLHRRNPALSAPPLAADQFASSMASSSPPFRIHLCIVSHEVVPVKERIGGASTRNQVFASKINAFACHGHHSDFWAKPRSWRTKQEPIPNSRDPDGKWAQFSLQAETKQQVAAIGGRKMMLNLKLW